MLVLSRRQNETIILDGAINGPIIIQVAKIRGDAVRLGITAPPDVHITRSELLSRNQNQAYMPASE